MIEKEVVAGYCQRGKRPTGTRAEKAVPGQDQLGECGAVKPG